VISVNYLTVKKADGKFCSFVLIRWQMMSDKKKSKKKQKNLKKEEVSISLSM